MKCKIYCDGAASNNGYSNAIGGWAFIVLDENDNIIIEQSDKVVGATNNRMELYAAYISIYTLLSNNEDVESIDIYTDSAYLYNCISQHWYDKWIKNGWINSKKQPVENKQLWQHLIPYFINDKIIFHKVPGHSGDKWNEYVDKLAVNARKSN